MAREHRSENVPTSNPPIHLRPARGVRLIERAGQVVAYPEPDRTPVLPAGWAPLSREQQDAVLSACDAAPDAMVLRLASPWEPGSEYRVYRLANDLWGGLSIVSRAVTRAGDPRTVPPQALAVNSYLLGLAWETARAVRLALDFFSWELEAQGQPWRLDVRDLTAEHS
jgi:hypothetical protein